MSKRWKTIFALVLVLGVLPLAGGLLFFVGHQYFGEVLDRGAVVDREATSASEAPEIDPFDRTALVLPLLPRPEGDALPLVTEGHPLVAPGAEPRIDPFALATLLRREEFALLDRHFATLQAAFDAHFRKDLWLAVALSAFESPDPRLEPLLDRWVESRPESWAARFARGAYRSEVGWHYRTSEVARDVSGRQMRAFRRELERAVEDLEAGLRANPRFLPGYTKLADAAHLLEDEHTEARAHRRVDALCPACIRPYEERINFLLPRWGGSYEAMAREAARAAAHVAENPDLAVIAGFADLDRCRIAEREEEYEEALAHCDRALAHGSWDDFRAERARVLAKLERYDEALLAIDRALAQAPTQLRYLQQRYWILRHLERDADALAMVRAIVYRDPANRDTLHLVEDAVGVAIHDGWEHREAGRRQEALALFDLAVMLDPANRDAQRRQADAVFAATRDEHLTVDALRARAAAAPDDFGAQRDLDYALAAERRYAEVVPVWDAYLARHPEDGRAYAERGGAHHHLRHRDQARADARRACDLGWAAACRHAR